MIHAMRLVSCLFHYFMLQVVFMMMIRRIYQMKTKKHLLTSTIAALVLSLFSSFPSEGCTGIQLRQKDGSNVRGRTLEFGVVVEPSIIVIPRGQRFQTKTTNGPGFEYVSKFAAVGTDCFNQGGILDGINEKGLSVAAFYFDGFAKYPTTNEENQRQSLSPVEFLNWIVTQFETVDEVRNAIAHVFISPVIVKEWGPNAPPPFHFTVFEKSGKCIVIEPIEGNLIVHDNPIGTLTNPPTFDWMLTNLRNYINLRAENVKPLVINDISFPPFGQGSGLVGLPGDFTPPSRFVRAAIYTASAIPSQTSEEGIFQLFHILNQFDIPIGAVREVIDGVIHTDYTQMTAASDPQTLKYYFKTYNNPEIKFIDLSKFDLDAKEIKRASIAGSPQFIDFSLSVK